MVAEIADNFFLRLNSLDFINHNMMVGAMLTPTNHVPVRVTKLNLHKVTLKEGDDIGLSGPVTWVAHREENVSGR